jgi:hypothetical protein
MIYIEIEKIVLWYLENINFKFVRYVMSLLKKKGIIDGDIELDF